MDGLSISEAARQTGFTASALRFYEGAGLIRPGRTAAGYRTYDAAALETLRFIARAKGLGLSLDDIGDLVGRLGERRCAPVQDQLSTLLQGEIDHARAQMAVLVALTAQVEEAMANLGHHIPDGPCDDDCGCTPGPAVGSVPSVAQSVGRAAGAAITCTLGPGEVAGRVRDWHDALRPASGGHAIEGGVRVDLPPGIPLLPLLSLIEAERTCCRFLTFTLTVGSEATTLDVIGPPGTEGVVRALVGAAVGDPRRGHRALQAGHPVRRGAERARVSAARSVNSTLRARRRA